MSLRAVLGALLLLAASTASAVEGVSEWRPGWANPERRTARVISANIQSAGDVDSCALPDGALSTISAGTLHRCLIPLNSTNPIWLGHWRININSESANLVAGESYTLKVWGCATAPLPSNLSVDCTALATFAVTGGATIAETQTPPMRAEGNFDALVAQGYTYRNLLIGADADDIVDAATVANLWYTLELEVWN